MKDKQLQNTDHSVLLRIYLKSIKRICVNDWLLLVSTRAEVLETWM